MYIVLHSNFTNLSAKRVNSSSYHEFNLRLKIDIEIKFNFEYKNISIERWQSMNDVTFWLFDLIMGIELKNVLLAVRGLETS